VSIEGLPDIRADFRAGQVCATVANVHRREDQDAYQAHDFMPVLREAMPDAKVGATDARPDATPDVQAQSRLIAALLGKQETP
jgi:hypothetical protein